MKYENLKDKTFSLNLKILCLEMQAAVLRALLSPHPHYLPELRSSAHLPWCTAVRSSSDAPI